MKSFLNRKAIAISGIALILTAVILFRGQKRIIPVPEVPHIEHNEGHVDPPSKENASPSLIGHIEQLKKKVAANPGDAASVKALAQLLMDSHKTSEAILYFNRGLELQPNNDSLLLDLSVCYFTEKRYDKAMDATERILKRDKNHRRALLNKGVILAVQKKNEPAGKIFRRVIAMAPQSEEAKQAASYLAEVENKR